MNTLAGFSTLAFGMTLAGGAVPLASKGMSRQNLWRFLSLGSGVLLAVTFMEILPEALGGSGAPLASWGLVGAFLLLFSLEHYAMMHACQEVLEDCHVHAIGWTALAAMTLHALLDGVNLAISFKAGPWAGGSVGAAMALHKFADGLTLTSLFRQSGFTEKGSALALAALGAATPVGALLGWYGIASFPAVQPLLLGFAAGCFLYIASADVLPRLHKENDTLCLVLFGLGLLSGSALTGLAG